VEEDKREGEEVDGEEGSTKLTREETLVILYVVAYPSG
jgi:hypothetical protein